MKIRKILEKDWPIIMHIQEESYYAIEPESLLVLRSKWILSATTCVVIEENSEILGYCLAHPWKDNSAPQLNSVINQCQDACGIFIHDLAVASFARKRGIGRELYFHLLKYALQNRFQFLSLVAIQNAEGFWSRLGFKPEPIDKSLASYGEKSVYMKLILKE